MKISIKNAQGQPVANLTAPAVAGLNRLSWDLHLTKDLRTEYGGDGGKPVPEGEYVVTLKVGTHESTQKLVVRYLAGVITR